jgi:DNA-binding LytR/AlgR family response regulator
MRKNVLIVEDNKAAVERLHKIIGEIDKETRVWSASSSLEGYQLAMQYTMDVFLVDIVLDTRGNADVSGIEFAQKIRTVEKYAFTPIIFTTSLVDPKMYAFTNIHSFAYLEKPYSSEEVKKTLSKALEYTTKREEDKNLFFRRDGLLFSVNLADVVYIENCLHKLKIQTINEVLEMPYRSCKKLMEEIESKEFVQCSRNCIVNVKFIDAMDFANRYFKLKSDYGRLEIGKAYVKTVRQHLGVEEI